MLITLFGCSESKKLDETERRGDIVVEALEHYREANHEYPEQLSDLIPDYINEISLPAWGLKEWFYEKYQDEFYLEAHESKRTGDGSSHWHRYDYENKWWEGGD